MGKTNPYCWLCEDPADCDLCLPEAPGQLDLFDHPPISKTSISERYHPASICDTDPGVDSKP